MYEKTEGGKKRKRNDKGEAFCFVFKGCAEWKRDRANGKAQAIS